MSNRIHDLADSLEAEGVDVEHLRELEHELELVEHPTAFQRISRGAIAMARRQWDLVMGEMRETGEMVSLVSRRVRQGEALSPEETDQVRTQLGDLLRLVPASIVVATNSTLPLPGTSLLTPLVLRKLGLLPSQWREAHLLAELEKEAAHLHEIGKHRAAERVEALTHALEDEAQAREQATHDANVLTHWDLDGNGVLDASERAAYEAVVDGLRVRAKKDAHKRVWYLSTKSGVVGPVRLTELAEVGPVMVCHQGRTGWVALEDLGVEKIG